MNKMLTDVYEFHKIYGSSFSDEPTIPNSDVKKLRLNLIDEELDELKEAFDDNNIIEVADALVDLLYVINGCAITCGIQDIINKYVDDIYNLKIENNLGNPKIPDKDISKLHVDLIKKELEHLTTAFDENNIAAIINAIYTMAFMVIKCVKACNLQNTYMLCHNEIHASNMSKLGEDGNPIKRDDGKILKGPNFFKPNLEKIIKNERTV
jgi:predicted HAD superfamily Cof-like phosphohydrolase